MSHTFGYMSDGDARVLERALGLCRAQRPSAPVRIIEIGVCDGKTARGMHDVLGGLLRYHGVDLGVDSRYKGAPFGAAMMTEGDSSEVYKQVEMEADLLVIDGCHCLRHVMLDFLLYAPKVVPGGYVYFHDSSAEYEGTDKQRHGPEGDADYLASIGKALVLLGLRGQRTDWLLIDEHSGLWGAVLFKRIA